MSKLWAERLTAIAMIVVAGFFVTQSVGLPGTSGTFPQFTEYVVIGLALIMFCRTYFTRDKKFAGNTKFDFSYAALKPVYVMIIAVIYAFAVFRVGFYVTSILFYFLVVAMTGYRNLKVIGIAAIVLFPLMYLVFNIGLDADLPEGILI